MVYSYEIQGGRKLRLSTFDNVGSLVLAHRLQRFVLHLALQLRGDAEEVDHDSQDGKDTGQDGDDGCCGRHFCGVVWT